MIVTHDLFEPREARDRMRCEPARHHCRLDATLIESTICPVPNNAKVIVSVVEWRDAVLRGSRQCDAISVRWINVCSPILSVERGLIGFVGRFVWMRKIHQQVKPES